MLEESRVFIELMKMPDGRVSITVGGGSINDGLMKEHSDLSTAIKDIEKRALTDYKRLKG